MGLIILLYRVKGAFVKPKIQLWSVGYFLGEANLYFLIHLLEILFTLGTRNNWPSHKIAKVLFVADGKFGIQKKGNQYSLVIHICFSFYCQIYCALLK